MPGILGGWIPFAGEGEENVDFFKSDNPALRVGKNN